MAAGTGISNTTVHRCLKTFSVRPHRQKPFRLSIDPFFMEKVRDIVDFSGSSRMKADSPVKTNQGRLNPVYMNLLSERSSSSGATFAEIFVIMAKCSVGIKVHSRLVATCQLMAIQALYLSQNILFCNNYSGNFQVLLQQCQTK